MNTDEKARDDQASAGDDSDGQTADMEEIIDLVDEVPADDDAGQVEQTPEIASETEDDEELIELTDVVEPEGEQGPEEEEPIELVDEVVPEADSAQEREEGEEEIIELTDEMVPEADSVQEQEEVVEPDDLAEELGLDIEEPGEDGLIDIFDSEITGEGPEIPAEEGLEDAGPGMLEEAEESLVDTGGTEPEAEDRTESGLEEGVSEPVGGALGQAVLGKLSDERLEEIITGVVKQTIEGKVERILLEAAEAAIAKEIERLKQAL
jgi:hypothetical protein